jgi:clan AA aspartic protease (TIGR02281 family)
MNGKDYPSGMEAYRQAADSFDDDPEIHLLGVKLALVFYDWQTAEKILYSHSFPINLTDQVRVLEKQIADLKFQENKIVIRFSPGSDQIPVSGVLNNRLSQNFIVDTGASMVTIPAAASEKLGIAVNGATPVRKLITAGGVIEAPEVILHSIQLDGWTEYNVTAYIVDMPNQSGLGLLGLNYLKRFRMDLNTESGILTLAPR